MSLPNIVFVLCGKGRRHCMLTHVTRGWQTLRLNGFRIVMYHILHARIKIVVCNASQRAEHYFLLSVLLFLVCYPLEGLPKIGLVKTHKN